MKLSPTWIRDFVDLEVDNRRLAGGLTSVGIGVEGISGEGDSTVFEAEITSNRPDEMNHYGVAREAAAIYDVPLKPLASRLPTPAQAASFPIEIQDADGCARFTARIVRGIRTGPSPARIAQRLALLDQRPINLAVDATNYTLWEMGKPTHAFDLDLLEGGKIVVRRAVEGETLKTLDGVERKLSGEDLVVADARKPVALAGVMGGYDTMITDKTRNVLIESAWWDPVTIRKTSKRHGLHTDASHRFERGADFESTILSCDRVAELILQAGGGQVAENIIDHIARRIDQAPVALHMSEVHRILGCRLTADDVVSILKRLGFDITPEKVDSSEFTVQIPSWRLDVEREIDLIEEVARLYGYDKFRNTLPAYSGSVIELPDARRDSTLRSSLLGLGYNEAVSLTFISYEDAKKFSAAATIEVANPLSEEASVMRTSMLPGMLNMLAYNLNRGIAHVRLFEAGKVYQYIDTSPLETKQISLGATGSAVVPSVNQPARPYSFFDLKGDIETLVQAFEHESLYFDAHTAEYFHPGRSARAVMDGVAVAQFGQIHPRVAADRKLRQDVLVGELYLDRLYNHELREPKYEALPRFPAVERDFSFVFAEAVVFEKIQAAIAALHIKELRRFVPVEIFRGGAIPVGKYSVLLRATFQSGKRTLREDEVADWSSHMIQALQGLDGVLRS